ncbi:hypothetical protein PV417_29170 [Streptomyces sp. ME19-03-3]|nr:hypothetical protein [Streptomyces sp. ME19-03-3]
MKDIGVPSAEAGALPYVAESTVDQTSSRVADAPDIVQFDAPALRRHHPRVRLGAVRTFRQSLSCSVGYELRVDLRLPVPFDEECRTRRVRSVHRCTMRGR